MKRMWKLNWLTNASLLILMIVAAGCPLFGQGTDHNKENKHNQAAAIPGDFADPSVIYVDGTYYATGTSSEWAPHYPIFTSADGRNWTSAGYVFKKSPSWAMSSFWAPELFYRNGVYYVYYTARRASDSVSCIGVATSNDPEKGFIDHGVVVEFGKEAIDAFVIEGNNELYITWKAYGLDRRPIELLGAQLSNDGLHLIGEPFTLLRDTAGRGLEGQCIVRHDNFFYLFYSAGACCGRACSYNVRVARSASLRGPYVNDPNNPVLDAGDIWKCPGHGTVVRAADDKWLYMYHAYSKKDNVYTGRQGLLTGFEWSHGWPVFFTDNIAGAGEENIITDAFRSAQLSDRWQWDFRYADPVVKVGDGQLCLSGGMGTDSVGTVVTMRPFSGDYDMSVTVDNKNSALKGLAVYGDVSEAVGVGVKGDFLEVWQVKEGKRSVVARQRLTNVDGIELMIKVRKGYLMQFYWREGADEWRPVDGYRYALDASFLPPWDRSPRPGLHHKGPQALPACFSNFMIRYVE